MPLVEPPLLPTVPPTPVILLVPPTAPAGAPPTRPRVPPAPGAAAEPDPNLKLMQTVLAAVNVMTQVNTWSN